MNLVKLLFVVCLKLIFAQDTQTIGVELEPHSLIRVFRYPEEPKPLIKNLPWWKPLGDLACEIGIEEQGEDTELGCWALEAKTNPLKFTEQAKFSASVVAVMKKFVNLAARFQELFKKNKPQIMNAWNTNNLEALYQYRVPYCALWDDGEPELKTSVMPRWKDTRVTGFVDSRTNNPLKFDDVRVWDDPFVDPASLFNFNPQITVAVPISSVIELLEHPDFGMYLNPAGGPPNVNPRIILDRILTIKEHFITKEGAKEYLFWLSYYVFATVKGAYLKGTCSLKEVKDGILQFNVRTKFSHIHNFVDRMPPAINKLPTGEALWNLVLKLALGCPMNVISCEDDAKVYVSNAERLKQGLGPHWWPFQGTAPSPQMPCTQAPHLFKIGGASDGNGGTTVSLSLKAVIMGLPNSDLFNSVNRALSTLPLQEASGKSAIIIEFRNPVNPCRSPNTAIWIPAWMDRYFYFFKAIATKTKYRMDTSPCTPMTYNPIVVASERNTDLLKHTNQAVNPCVKKLVDDRSISNEVKNQWQWSAVLACISLVGAALLFGFIYFQKRRPDNTLLYNEMA